MGYPKDPERDKRIAKRRAAGETYASIAAAEGLSPQGAFLACKRLNPEIVRALKKANASLDRILIRVVDHMDQNYDRGVSLAAAKELLRVHNVGQDNEATNARQAPTNVMVIIGATDDRMKALKAGNVIEVSSTDSNPKDAR